MENLTLVAALTLVSIVASAALFINWAGNRLVPGLLPIAVGFSVSSIGISLLATQGLWPVIVSIFVANSLTLLGRIPLLIGLAKFWNQDANSLITSTSVLCALTIAGLFFFTIPVEDTQSRIWIYTSMMVIFDLSYVYIISTGIRIERKLRPITSISPNFGAFSAIAMFTFNAVIELVLMFLRGDAPLNSTDTGTSILLLGSIFTMVVFAFIIIIMTMEELSIEHQENAIFDPITTILNHRTFLEVGQRVMGIALRYSKPVSLLTIEVDAMDTVVKKFGRKVANAMLRHFSLMATDRRRNEDVLARTGFKEFRMLLPGVDEKGCQVVIKKVNKALAAESFEIKGEKVPITVTVSSVTRKEEDLNLSDMLQEGDIELHRLKLKTQ